MATADEPKRPERDLKLEALGKVLRREMRARVHAHRADDMLTAIRIAEEFDLDLTLEHATEGYKIADILAAKVDSGNGRPHPVFADQVRAEGYDAQEPGRDGGSGCHCCHPDR